MYLLLTRYAHEAKHSLVKHLYLMSRYISLVLTSMVIALNYLNESLATCNMLVRFNCAAMMTIQSICETESLLVQWGLY